MNECIFLMKNMGMSEFYLDSIAPLDRSFYVNAFLEEQKKNNQR